MVSQKCAIIAKQVISHVPITTLHLQAVKNTLNLKPCWERLIYKLRSSSSYQRNIDLRTWCLQIVYNVWKFPHFARSIYFVW